MHCTLWFFRCWDFPSVQFSYFPLPFWLAIPNHCCFKKRITWIRILRLSIFRNIVRNVFSDLDCQSKIAVDVISGILDRQYITSALSGNHSNRFSAVTAEGKQKVLQFFILRDNVLYYIIPPGQCIRQIHPQTFLSGSFSSFANR